MTYAKQVIVDNIRSWHWQIGYNFEFENSFYKILDMQDMEWDQTTGSVATVSTSTVDFDTNLKPHKGYGYWIEFVGIDGFVGFQPLFKNYPQMTPHREAKYWYKEDAGRFNMKYMPHLILDGDYPTYQFYNPKGSAYTGHMYWKGKKFRLELLDSLPAGEIAVPITSYMRASLPG